MVNRDSSITQRRVEELRKERVLIDGVWVHPRAKHGTTYGYNRFSCHCDPCREANNEYQRQRQRRRRITSVSVAAPVIHRLSDPVTRDNGVTVDLCCHCFENFPLDEMEPDSGGGSPWDVCKPCAAKDKTYGGQY